jgi:uncharacterized protein with PIN domain
VRYWDSSALVPLFFDEPTSQEMARLVADDPDVVVWALTSVELLSMIARLERSSEGLEDLLSGVRRDALERIRCCNAVTLVDAVRQRAERLEGFRVLGV